MPRRDRHTKALYGPPVGQPWAWLPISLMESPAWQEAGISTRRLVDFLMIEHRNHGGRENGALMATYDQLERFGLTRETIPAAVDEAEFLGLIRVKRGGRYRQTNNPSTYRLTFYADRDGGYATNEWKKIDKPSIAAWRAERRAKARAKAAWRVKIKAGGVKPHPDSA